MDSDYRPDRHPTFSYKRAKNLKLLLCAVVLGTLLASAVHAQVLQGTILLPDSLGPLPGATHVALDETPAYPRMFVGSEIGDVLVVDSRTGARIARIETGRVKDLCYSPVRNKLYVSTTNPYGYLVIDCSSYQVTKQLPMSYVTTALLYNPLIDRVYCATWGMRVIDCATDSIVDSLPMYTKDAIFALDTAHNKLYIGAEDTFRVLDCGSDSVVYRSFGLRKPQSVCFAPSPAENKVYVAAGESLFALSVKTDTVVYRQNFHASHVQLASDPQHDRVYYAYWSHSTGLVYLLAIDCATDSIIWSQYPWARCIGLAAASAENKVYALLSGLDCTFMYALDGSTGQELRAFEYFYYSGLHYSALLHRLFIAADGGGEDNTRAIDCTADTVVAVTPLGAYIGYCPSSVCVDSLGNKLYFSASASGVGVVDCFTNTVTSYVSDCDLPTLSPPQALAHDSRDDKLYFSSDSSICVLDCRTDSVVKEIPIGGRTDNLVWYPRLNKLYVFTVIEDVYGLVVIDCAGDTVKGFLEVPGAPGNIAFLSPELDQLWLFGFYVVDCLADTLLKDTGMRLNCEDADYDPSSRRVYALSLSAMYVVDMETRLPIESLPRPPSGYGWSRQVYCAEGTGKVYWIYQNGEYLHETDSVFVFDPQLDSITAVFNLPFMSTEVCEDRTGDYVYFASGGRISVVDTRCDSVVSSVGTLVGAQSLVRNNRTNRLYIAGRQDSVIQVAYDSIIFAGVGTLPAGPPLVEKRLQTVVNRSAPLRSPTDAVLFDPSGRRVVVLRPGPNDIGHLAPGVYFVREEPQASSFKPQAVRKIVVTR